MSPLNCCWFKLPGWGRSNRVTTRICKTHLSLHYCPCSRGFQVWRLKAPAAAVGISAVEGQRDGLGWGEAGTAPCQPGEPALPSSRKPGPWLWLRGCQVLQAVVWSRKGFISPQKPHALPWVEAVVPPDSMQKASGGLSVPSGTISSYQEQKCNFFLPFFFFKLDF